MPHEPECPLEPSEDKNFGYCDFCGGEICEGETVESGCCEVPCGCAPVMKGESMEPKVGSKVLIKHLYGEVSHHTPAWCLGWTGTVIRLNKQTVTVEFEVDEPGRKTLQRYIDYQDIFVLEE